MRWPCGGALRTFANISETRPSEQAELEVAGDLKVIGSPDGLRTAAKIAYIGLAFCGGPKFAASDAFAKVREYIKTGNGASPARLFVHEYFLNAVENGAASARTHPSRKA
jgi:hypothetical protein